MFVKDCRFSVVMQRSYATACGRSTELQVRRASGFAQEQCGTPHRKTINFDYGLL